MIHHEREGADVSLDSRFGRYSGTQETERAIKNVFPMSVAKMDEKTAQQFR